MAAIKHWGRRYDAVQEHICSAPGCMREGMEIEHGQVRCAGHLALRLEVVDGSSGIRSDMLRIRRLRVIN